MVYLKAFLVGVVTAIVLAIAAIFVEGEIAVRLARLESRSGGIGSVSFGLVSVAPAAFLGFVGGFYWTLRRSRQQMQA
jgi:hypothetical protein